MTDEKVNLLINTMNGHLNLLHSTMNNSKLSNSTKLKRIKTSLIDTRARVKLLQNER